MKHLSGLWHKLTVIVAVTASLSSCNRAEYAMLPKTSSYHGTEYRAVTAAPAPKTVTSVAEAAPAPVVAAPEKAEAVAAAPQGVSATEKAAAPVAGLAKAQPAKAPKLTLAQKALVQKIAKKADKLTSKVQLKQSKEVAGANRLEGKLRQGLILILVSLLVGILASLGGTVGTLFSVLAAILFVVGAVLIILYLLDEL